MKTHGTDSVSGFLKEDENWRSDHGPLTKREYFAAMAMQGDLSSQSSEIGVYNTEASFKMLAERSVKMADALIDALNKEGKDE